MASPIARIAALAPPWPVLWLIALALELAVGSVAVWLAGTKGPALVGLGVNLLVALRFAVTLRPGAVPLITRYGRHDPAGLPVRAEPYTRRLTLAWALLLGLFALAYAVQMLGVWTVSMISTAEAMACTAFFLGEHALRRRLFPELGHVSPGRTLRAVFQAAGARHAG
ncbi:hypothetical protein JYK14_17795 [Siccirubricoccus sp. KC 17139]|uniref:Uncharacterized protein n=1 Tax=Siccirubricoccus soli TaxID=2899147 RepID=A0ABT1D7T7_9PROT|nr:hypothetical protein [Siccirubricoccus soli]MCO6417999.1 hypothetical protein [Siccirubricoccus soli]MCP2684134.1 hypothetical protein [Siccirubricoccus soli]